MTTKQVTNVRAAYGMSQAAGNLDYDSQMIMGYNASGSTIAAGSPVVVTGVDSTGRPLIAATATANSVDVIGVTAEAIANNDAGLVVIAGYVLANTVAGLTALALVATSTTSGSVGAATPAIGAVVGIFVVYTVSTTQGLVYVKLS